MKRHTITSPWWIAALAGAVLALAGFTMGRSSASVNQSLLALVEDLSGSLGGSTVVAAALVAGSCILAAVLVPLTIALVATHAVRKEAPEVAVCRCGAILEDGPATTPRRLGPGKTDHRRHVSRRPRKTRRHG